MKKAIPKILKLFALFAVLLHFGCSKDLYDEPFSEGKFKISKVAISDPLVFYNYQLMQEIQKIKQKQEILTAENKFIHDTINGFYFDDQNGLLIEKKNGYKSFTFPIYRDAPSEQLENIVFSLKENDEYEPYLSEYTLSEQQRQLLNEGQLTDFSAIEMNFTPLNSSVSSKCGWNLEMHLNDAGNFMINEWIYTACGGGSDGGGNGGINTGSSNGSGGNDGLGGGEGSGGNLGGILTSPVDAHHGGGGGGSSSNFQDTPCGRIQKGTSSTAYKQKFKGLNKTSNYNLSYESGFLEKKENGITQYVNAIPEGINRMHAPLGTMSYTHVHNNNLVTTDSGDELDINVKMPSPADVYAVLTTCQNSQVNANNDPREAFGVILSNEGIFAVTLLEPISPAEIRTLNPKLIAFEYDYKEQAEMIINNLNLDASGRKIALQKMLLQLLKDAGLENKVGLFEGEVELEPGQLPKINWTKKTLNPTNPDADPVESPC